MKKQNNYQPRFIYSPAQSKQSMVMSQVVWQKAMVPIQSTTYHEVIVAMKAYVDIYLYM